MRKIVPVLVVLLIFPGFKVIPVWAGESGPSWFAWGQAWFRDTTEGDFVEDGGASHTDDPSSSFEIKRARFGVRGWAADGWLYHFMFEGAGDKPKLLQAWVEYEWKPELKIRAGQFKHGFGREALPSASEWRFINPSYVVGELGAKHVSGGSSFRDQGMMAYGNLRPGETTFDYSIFLMNGSGINVTDTGPRGYQPAGRSLCWRDHLRRQGRCRPRAARFRSRRWVRERQNLDLG